MYKLIKKKVNMLPRLGDSTTSTFPEYFRAPGNPKNPNEKFKNKKSPNGKEIISKRARLLANAARTRNSGSQETDVARYDQPGPFPRAERRSPRDDERIYRNTRPSNPSRALPPR